MRYLTFEGEDLKKIQNTLKTQYGDEVLILNVEQKEKGLLKKKKYFSVVVGIEDEVYNKSINRGYYKRKKAAINDSQNSLFEEVNEKEIKEEDKNTSKINSKYTQNKDNISQKLILYKHVKNIIEEKSKLLNNNINTYDNKSSILNTYQNDIKVNELKDFFSLKLNDIENKIQMIIQNTNKINLLEEKGVSLIDKFCDSLSNFDFSKDYINHLKEKFRNSLSFNESQSIEVIKSKVYEEIENNINICCNTFEKGDVIVLIGPTGVGKTTTLVKLASQYRVYKDMNIKFLTIDQYKIGAVDHLNNYAEILKTKCEIIRNKDDLIKNIVDDTDLIFVDTLGTSQKDNHHLAIIKDRLDIKKKKLKIFLTISATTKYSDIIDIIERFKFINYDSIIVTKLDETNTLGQVVSALWKFNLPISFLTNGQDILETLIVPDKKKIMDILFQGERIYD
ncbi:MAG: AAA family ATPase [Spirochaetes bacterium]|nr:AAA family ATPase [Spirochaetota bacterium]